MKKTLLCTTLLAGCTQLLQAQAVFTATDLNPQVNDAFVSITCDTFNIVPGPAGHQTWNFAGLLAMSADTAYALNCSATPVATMYPSATIATKSLSTSAYNFYIASSTTFSQDGYYQSSTQKAVFSNAMEQFHYPVHYLDSFTDAYAGILTFTPTTGLTVNAHETGTVKVVCDGWGSVVLPGGITDTGVLRMHSYQIFTDSANVFGIDTVAHFTINSYSWYKKGYHSPILTVLISDQIGGAGLHFKTVTYAKKYPLAVSGPQLTEQSVEVFPNPAEGELNIRYQSVDQPAVINLYDITGRLAATVSAPEASGMQTVSMHTSQLPAGIYLLKVQTAGATITKSVSIR